MTPPKKDKDEATEPEAAATEAAATEATEAEATEPEATEDVAAGTEDAEEAPADADADADEADEADEPAAVDADEPATDEPAADAEEKPKRRRAPRRRRSEPAEEPAPGPKRRRDGERVVVRAQARYVRSSARKARLVCDLIRGKSVADARAILAMSPRAAARDWIKVLESAVANAENNHELDGDDLRIHTIKADEGPTLKRYRPRAMGRATRIRKRTSHLTILLTPKE